MSVERQLMMAAGGGQQQYTISNSLRFRSSASAYLSRTPASAGNQTTWTLSFWCKRGALSRGSILDVYINQYTWFVAGFDSSNCFYLYEVTGVSGVDYGYISTAVFRDPSAWYHIVLKIDTTQSNVANRAILYVNNVQQVFNQNYGDYPQNFNTLVNSTNVHAIGKQTDANYYFDGYLTEVNFIDGQALTPSSFGETSSTTGVWIPKKYTGTYGTNGFYLNFNNNTSTTALGYDTSGNGNNWTPNNFSLTTGSTYDSMIDSPTSYASGANNVGNYCVLNPLVRLNTNTAMTFSQANLVCVGGGAWSPTLGTIQYPSTGKWYWEATFNGSAFPVPGPTSNYSYVGVSNTSNTSSYGLDTASTLILGDTGYGSNFASINTLQYGSLIQGGAIVGIAIDRSANTFTFYVNNSVAWTGTINYTSGAILAPFIASYDGSYTTLAINFGQRPFAYTPPSGYKALNTYNLSTPSIVDGSKQMAATTYTGTGASLSVSGANFTPGFVWIKSRSAATDHALYDVIRGTQARLESNTTDAEVTSDNGVTAFNSTGFTVGTLAQVNTSSATYIGWQWKANGAGVSNTDGTITSTVSANQTAGFSVVTFTSPASGSASVGHGLGVTPAMFVIKSRSPSTSTWVLWHTSLASTTDSYLNLSNTNAVATSAGIWGSGPNSSVFGIGTGAYVASNTYVAYCWAAIPGYSAFGSYTGNGSSDGPFVYCGFRPRFILRKGTVTAGVNWSIIDTSRNTYNAANSNLYPNLSDAEGSSGDIDITSNGFKCRSSSFNASSEVYIYAAFAENPFKYSLAR